MPTLPFLAGLSPCSCAARLRWLPWTVALCLAAALAPAASAQTAPRDQGRTWRVAILVYPGVELLDFSGPGEVFAATMAHGRHPFEVVTVAASKEPLVSQGFLTITPSHDLDSCPPPDIVVLPGGNVPLSDERVVAWVERVAADAEVVMSVCNGALLADEAGLLDGLRVTTHRSALMALALRNPTLEVRPELRLVDSGRVLTTGGVSAGIDGALALVARLVGRDRAQATADYMEYRWLPDDPSSPVAVERSGDQLAAASRLIAAVTDGGAAAGLALYRDELSDSLGESTLNDMGYAYLRPGRDQQLGVALLTLTATLFPRSANARDSLSEGLALIGRHEDAVAQARECLRLLDEAGERAPGNADLLRRICRERIAHLQGDGAG